MPSRQPFDLQHRFRRGLLDDSLGDSQDQDGRPQIGAEFASEQVTEPIVRLPASRGLSGKRLI
jgi:hypothetical protein